MATHFSLLKTKRNRRLKLKTFKTMNFFFLLFFQFLTMLHSVLEYGKNMIYTRLYYYYYFFFFLLFPKGVPSTLKKQRTSDRIFLKTLKTLIFSRFFQFLT